MCSGSLNATTERCQQPDTFSKGNEFKSMANKTMADWHVPGIAISIVHGDEIFAEVCSLPAGKF
jgi:hypothetical protein